MADDKIQVTAEQLSEVAKELGVEVVDSNDTFDIHTVLGAIDNARKPFIQKDIEATVVPDVVSKQIGKLTGTLRHELKKLTGYENKEESIEVAMSKAFETYAAKAKEGVNADIQEMQKRMQELEQLKEQEKEQAVNAVKGEYSALQQRILDKEAVELLYKEVDKMKLKGDKLTHTQDLHESLKRDYVVTVENGELKFFDKSNPNLPAQHNKKMFNLAEYSEPYFEKRGSLEKDMRGVRPVAPKPPNGAPVTNKTQRVSAPAAAAADFLAKQGIEV